jgi:hypothetical protein
MFGILQIQPKPSVTTSDTDIAAINDTQDMVIADEYLNIPQHNQICWVQPVQPSSPTRRSSRTHYMYISISETEILVLTEDRGFARYKTPIKTKKARLARQSYAFMHRSV